MFREKFIARVPDSTLEAANFLTRRWQRTFNFACWVRFQMPKPNTVTLVIHFTDDEGNKEAIVDKCQTELQSTVLLSNHITIEGKGKVKEMGIYLRVSDNSSAYVIDELYAQSCEQQGAAYTKVVGAA